MYFISFQWEDQHKGISCSDFTKWKAENDEGNQQKGLAAFLKENGIGEARVFCVVVLVLNTKVVESGCDEAFLPPCYSRVPQVPLPL